MTLLFERFKDKFYISYDERAQHTTPDYSITIQRDGKIINSISFDDYNRIHFNGLDKYLLNIETEEISTFDKYAYENYLKQTNNELNILKIDKHKEDDYKNGLIKYTLTIHRIK